MSDYITHFLRDKRLKLRRELIDIISTISINFRTGQITKDRELFYHMKRKNILLTVHWERYKIIFITIANNNFRSYYVSSKN
jgi:hypothetical protein